MDEIKETNQDTSAKDASGGSEETTPKVDKTFTEAEVEKRISDTLATKGRDAKSFEIREAAIKAQEQTNKEASVELERQRLETQRKAIEAVAEDPEARKALLHQYDIEERERKHAAKVKADEDAVQQMFWDAEALATEYNLKPSDLLSAKTPEEMKLLAKNLALQRDLDSKQTKDTPKEKEGFEKPDSNTSDAGADSDEAFVEGWNSGDIPATKENLARSQKILNK